MEYGRFKTQNEKSNNRIYKPRNFHIPVYLDREYMRSYTQTDILADDSTRILYIVKKYEFYRNYIMYIEPLFIFSRNIKSDKEPFGK